jgi:hypothetical protein
MTAINCTLFELSHRDVLLSVFGEYSNDFEYTVDGIFRRRVSPLCSCCGARMVHNGYNIYQKKGLGSVKIGRYICPVCKESCEETRGFWEQMQAGFFGLLDRVYQLLRLHHVSYEGISEVMGLVFPKGKDAIASAFNGSVELAIVPPVGNILIIHYDEQHPKQGRSQKFRLTILDGVTGRPIADELFDAKDPETIKLFLAKHLDPTRLTFIVTDMAPSYPEVLKEFFGNNLIHQFCLLHLNKRIVQDFPRHTTIAQELVKYRLLDIFYNRDAEIKFLEPLAEEEQQFQRRDTWPYQTWLKESKKAFNRFLHEQELHRRRMKMNLEQRTYNDAWHKLNGLLEKISTFDTHVQKRLRMIQKNWERFTAFYLVEGAPATNNLIENYYSTSLKTHRKKQFRTDRGIQNQMKVSKMKRAGMLDKQHTTLLDTFLRFTPFLKPG